MIPPSLASHSTTRTPCLCTSFLGLQTAAIPAYFCVSAGNLNSSGHVYKAPLSTEASEDSRNASVRNFVPVTIEVTSAGVGETGRMCLAWALGFSSQHKDSVNPACGLRMFYVFL